MFNRLKGVLVESYVGAIGLGYLLAQGVLHFVSIFASPVATWVSRKQYGYLAPSAAAPPAGFPLEAGLPELIRFILLLLVWFILLRWLYFTPASEKSSDSGANVEQVQ